MHRGRFAPSPTGPLHFGSLVAAVGSWLFARSGGGEWLVRMEDLDRKREVPGAAADILSTLTAFGLESDREVVVQSARTTHYARALRTLDLAGHVYRCWCSRSDLDPFKGIHPAQCPSSPGARTPAWRVRVGTEIEQFNDAIQARLTQDLAREVGDFVVWRADGVCAYQLAVVVDDDAQGITQVVRGADLLDSTPRQRLLLRMLGMASPTYVHLPVVLGDDGRKLSKVDRATPVDASNPLPALRAALRFLGQEPPAGGDARTLLSAAVAAFDPALIPRSATIPLRYAATQKDL
ncbi:MAG: tRNA glutamyl-Q(34) synthetase GluQRS [Dokdonella sp.]|uniref:tRNA glutamyl-Q(34) synthetase GluQRS n=1 Tax=Dokdonella sp. TaxID=2291710 RepID=UPI0032640217